mmetsp:Transcript_71203/g.190084  ORF Transcript_71203/g.190084 Transcript_71203/m.190084 type:complete len:294 (+) Transcript_71203:427-1308(+)
MNTGFRHAWTQLANVRGSIGTWCFHTRILHSSASSTLTPRSTASSRASPRSPPWSSSTHWRANTVCPSFFATSTSPTTPTPTPTSTSFSTGPRITAAWSAASSCCPTTASAWRSGSRWGSGTNWSRSRCPTSAQCSGRGGAWRSEVSRCCCEESTRKMRTGKRIPPPSCGGGTRVAPQADQHVPDQHVGRGKASTREALAKLRTQIAVPWREGGGSPWRPAENIFGGSGEDVTGPGAVGQVYAVSRPYALQPVRLKISASACSRWHGRVLPRQHLWAASMAAGEVKISTRGSK